MRKLILFILTVSLCYVSAAQENELRRGYIGITLGPAIPLGDVDNSAVSSGAQLNLVNFGYLFSKNVGIATTWFGTSFMSKANNKNFIGMGGLLLGPLFSTMTNSGKVEFDFKPMIGIANGTEKMDGETYTTERAFAFGLGGAARWNCGRRISLSGGVDYYYGKPEKFDLSSVAIVFGINYRLK